MRDPTRIGSAATDALCSPVRCHSVRRFGGGRKAADHRKQSATKNMKTQTSVTQTSNARTRRALATAKRNGDFGFFCAHNDFRDADKIVADLIASGKLVLAAK